MSHVVIEFGPGGCAIYDGFDEILCPAYAVEAVDTTGAGDCFVAGFIAACPSNLPLEETGRFANAVGAVTVQKIGAVEGVLPGPLVRDWRSRQLTASSQ